MSRTFTTYEFSLDDSSVCVFRGQDGIRRHFLKPDRMDRSFLPCRLFHLAVLFFGDFLQLRFGVGPGSSASRFSELIPSNKRWAAASLVPILIVIYHMAPR